MPPPLSAPDPLLSANLYCAGNLDGLIAQVVVDVWRELESLDPQAYLWIHRYPRGGEHLKLRVHGCDSERIASLRPSLEEAASRFFGARAALVERGDLERGDRRPSPAPAIDVEDEDDGLRADDSLLWTQYRRSPISLGGPPFTDRDAFVARVTRCLGASCAWYLERVETNGVPSPEDRHHLFAQLVLSGLDGLGLDEEGKSAFLLYYRDWQARTPMRRIGASQAKADAWLGSAHQKMASRTDLRDAIAALAESRTQTDRTAGDREESWTDSLRALREDVEAFRDDERYVVDPFAVDMLFAPVLKVFTGTANQLGFQQMEEVRAVQLLLLTLYGEHALRPIALSP